MRAGGMTGVEIETASMTQTASWQLYNDSLVPHRHTAIYILQLHLEREVGAVRTDEDMRPGESQEQVYKPAFKHIAYVCTLTR